VSTTTCFRCDWVGTADGATCPSCGAAFYRSSRAAPPPPAAEPPSFEVGAGASEPVVHPTEARAVGSDLWSVLSVVGAVAVVIFFLLAQGAPDATDEVVAPPSPSATSSGTGGRLVYAVPARDGMARLWRWNLDEDRVVRGPLVAEPLALVNVASPGYGWLGLTSDLGDGRREASLLGSLGAGSRARSLGRGNLVTWARQGRIAVLVDVGPVSAGCRRSVDVTAVEVPGSARERIDHGPVCGDVLSVGRTSIGYFMTVLRDDGVDVVGFGYPDPGVLLHGYGVIDVAPGGDLLVTPAQEFLPGDGPATTIAGEASRYRMFGGPPEDLLADAAPLAIERVLAYAAGGTRVLVVGHQGRDGDAIWELPLGFAGSEPAIPRYIVQASGVTEAAYASDGTAFVLTNRRLFHLDGGHLSAAPLPEGAPMPDGPLAWIAREPTGEI
jgi:hypothetical protein